jgi:hypothetical protein
MNSKLYLPLLLTCCHLRAYAAFTTADFGDAASWQPVVIGVGPTISTTGAQADVTIPASSHGDGVGGPTWTATDFAAAYESTFSLRGDFDVTVAYNLIDWPSNNGMRIGIGIAPWYGSQRVSQVYFGSPPGTDAYVFDAGGVTGVTPTTDLSGQLRMARTGSSLAGYYWSAASQSWVLIGSGAVSPQDFGLAVSAWSGQGFFSSQAVQVSFSNLRITADDFTTGVPPVDITPVPEPSTYLAGLLMLVPFCAQAIRYLRLIRA